MDNLNPKAVWPGWRTVRLIGRGSFGSVYEIERDLFGEKEKAALKLITIPLSPGDVDPLRDEGYSEDDIARTFRDYLKSILGEYSLMRRLNSSPNVVNCEDVRCLPHKDGIGWDILIKMELLMPLPRVLGGEVTEAQALRVGVDISRALTLCRKHNIIHRDIKPGNIFVSRNGDCKLGDFGIAKTVEQTTRGTLIGTYEYMAPEVYNHQPYGHGADVYSLGLVLYWMLNERRLPFLPLPPELPSAAQKEQARLRRMSGEPLPAPAHGSMALKLLVLRACSFDPINRYASAEELLQDLEELQMKQRRSLLPREPAPAEPDRLSAAGAVAPLPESRGPVSRPAPAAPGTAPPARRAVPPKKKRASEESEADSSWLPGAIFIAAITILLILLVPKGVPDSLDRDAAASGNEAAVETFPAPERSAEEYAALGFQATEDGLFWKLEEGVLTLGGSGAMANYRAYEAPWYEHRREITSLVIEPGVTAVGSWAFVSLHGLRALQLPAGLRSVGEGAFYDCTSLGEAALPAGLTAVGKNAFAGCVDLSALSLPEGLQSIGERAFFNCSSLSELRLPAGLASIGDRAFENCSSLTTAEFPAGLASIGAQAFKDCGSLEAVTLPAGLTALSDETFWNCASLRTVTLPEGLRTIGERAFWHARDLRTLTLPASLASIGAYAFAGFEKLSEVCYAGTPEQWAEISIGEGNDVLLPAIRFGAA